MNYRLEVWGAHCGGWGGHANSPGGYSCGWKTLSKNQILYVVVGGKGIDANHYTDGTSYNGGGIASSPRSGGGGATHIATVTGLLKDLVNNKPAVICVAGGAGSNGGWAEDGDRYKSGGGLVGLGSPTKIWLSYTETATTKGDTGGTQTGCGPDGIKGGFGFGGSTTSGNAGAGGGGVVWWQCLWRWWCFLSNSWWWRFWIYWWINKRFYSSRCKLSWKSKWLCNNIMASFIVRCILKTLIICVFSSDLSITCYCANYERCLSTARFIIPASK